VERIAIIGLGQIGSTLGQALKRLSFENTEIVGHDREPLVASASKKLRAVDKLFSNLLNTVESAQLVILAVPVLAIRDVMELIAPVLPEGCIVTDTGSTKVQIMKWAEEYLPSTVNFVGGHPMIGRETPGVEGADQTMLSNATYAITPSTSASNEAVATVVKLVELMGARPYFVDAVEHDSLVAAISHLPMILSAALVSTVASSPSWPEMEKMASGGFESVSRLASGSPVMHRDICLTNETSIVFWLDSLMRSLTEYRNLLTGSEPAEGLENALSQAWEARQTWLTHRSDWRGETVYLPPPPSLMDQVKGFIGGERLVEKEKQILEAWRSRRSGPKD